MFYLYHLWLHIFLGKSVKTDFLYMDLEMQRTSTLGSAGIAAAVWGFPESSICLCLPFAIKRNGKVFFSLWFFEVVGETRSKKKKKKAEVDKVNENWEWGMMESGE